MNPTVCLFILVHNEEEVHRIFSKKFLSKTKSSIDNNSKADSFNRSTLATLEKSKKSSLNYIIKLQFIGVINFKKTTQMAFYHSYYWYSLHSCFKKSYYHERRNPCWILIWKVISWRSQRCICRSHERLKMGSGSQRTQPEFDSNWHKLRNFVHFKQNVRRRSFIDW